MRFYPLDVGSVDTANVRKTRHLLLERQGLGREGPVGIEEYLKNKDVGIGL